MDTQYSSRMPAFGGQPVGASKPSKETSRISWTDGFDVDQANQALAAGASAVELVSLEKVLEGASVILLSEDHLENHAFRYLAQNIDTLRGLDRNEVVIVGEGVPQGLSVQELLENPCTPTEWRNLMKEGFCVAGMETSQSVTSRFRCTRLITDIVSSGSKKEQARYIDNLCEEIGLDIERFHSESGKEFLAVALQHLKEMVSGRLMGRIDLQGVSVALEAAIYDEMKLELKNRKDQNEPFAAQIADVAAHYQIVIVQMGRNHTPDANPQNPGVESLVNNALSKTGRAPAASIFMSPEDVKVFERKPHKVGNKAQLWLPGAAYPMDSSYRELMSEKPLDVVTKKHKPLDKCLVM